MKAKRLGSLAIILMAVLMMVVVSRTEETKHGTGLTWIRYDDGLKQAAKAKKPIIVDFYTDWCGFCKKMDKMTYADSTVSKYLKEHFVMVKVNGESKDPLTLPTGSMTGRELTRSFSVTGYPTTWFLDPTGQRIDKLVGYVGPDKLIIVLRYFGDGSYKTQTWENYYAKVTNSN
jgi:thioredoxin-related protein